MYVTRDRLPSLRARGSMIMGELRASREAMASGRQPGQGAVGIPFPMRGTRAMPVSQRAYAGTLSVAEESGVMTFLNIMRARMARQPDRVRAKVEELIGSRRVAGAPSRSGQAAGRGDFRGAR